MFHSWLYNNNNAPNFNSISPCQNGILCLSLTRKKSFKTCLKEMALQKSIVKNADKMVIIIFLMNSWVRYWDKSVQALYKRNGFEAIKKLYLFESQLIKTVKIRKWKKIRYLPFDVESWHAILRLETISVSQRTFNACQHSCCVLK